MSIADANRPSRSLLLPSLVIGWGGLGCLLLLVLDLSPVAQVLGGGLWFVGWLVLARPYWVTLYGPVMAYDFIRVGRKPRVIWFRVVYAGVMAIVFVWIYFTGIFLSDRYYGTTLQTKELARIAESFFETFMVIQFILVSILTPASVGGAIADEKERRTLEFLLATDLRDREILFGKLASRVGSLLLFLAAGLPILGMIQFFGGIDPNLVIAGFLVTLITILSLAALGIAASVLSRRARDAIVLTYLLAGAYVLLSVLVYALALSPWLRGSFELFGYTVTTEDLAYPVVAGNPFFQVIMHQERRSFQAPESIFLAVRDYTLFHALFIVLFVGWSAWRLRTLALQQLFGSGPRRRNKKTPGGVRAKGATSAEGLPIHGVTTVNKRPDVGDSPILWKETFVDSGMRLSLVAKIIVWLLIALSFFPIGIIIWDCWFETYSWMRDSRAAKWERMAREVNGYARVVGTMVASLIFLAIAVRGGGMISGERDKHTLDVLLTTPLPARRILWGKWWGCLLGLRWGWAWLFTVWLIGLALGGIHPIMMVALLGSVVVYAAGFAWIGLWCSLHFSTTLKASMAAIVASIFCGGGYFLVFVFCCLMPLSFGGTRPGNELNMVVDGLCSLSPSVNLAWLPISDFRDREITNLSADVPYFPFWAFGLIVWGGGAFALSRSCLDKFRRMANRLPLTPEPNPWESTGPRT